MAVREDEAGGYLWSFVSWAAALVAAIIVAAVIGSLAGAGVAAGVIFGGVVFVALGYFLTFHIPTRYREAEAHAHAPARAPSVTAPAPAHAPAVTAPAPAAAPPPAAPAPPAPVLHEPAPVAPISERVRAAARAAGEAARAAAGPVGEPPPPAAASVARPSGLSGPRDGAPDDLKRIKGVGPKLEELLHSLGFYHFDQVAAWGPDEIAWVDSNLEGFNGRATRDDWVGQARLLAQGGETEFSRRADRGEVN